MKYYKEADGNVWAFEEDGSQDFRITETMVLMSDEEIFLHTNPPPTLEELAFTEAQWVSEQNVFIAEQLLMLEDGDPNALPVVPQQWRDFRIALRSWKEGNPDFPDQNKRPVKPE